MGVHLGWTRLGRRGAKLASLAGGVCLLIAACGGTPGKTAPAASSKPKPQAASAQSGASGSSSQAAAPGVTASTITFGQTVPKSGPAALYGESTYGVQAYFDYVNAQGGVLGRKLKLISLDDKYQPAVAVQDTRTLLNQDHVFAEVAVNGTSTTQAVLPIVTAANVPVIGPQTGATPIQGVFRKDLYNVWPSYLTEGKMLAAYAQDKLHLKKIGVLYQNDDFGKSLYQGVKNAGVKPALAIPYDPSQTDFGPQAEKFKSAGCDGVIILAIPGPTITFLNAMAAIDYRPARLMSQVSAIPQSFSAAKSEFPGSYIGAFIPPLSQTSNPQVKTFLDAMKKYQPGKPASVFAAWGWTEAQVAVAGLKGVKGALTRDSYEAALNSLSNLQTLGGSVSYTPTSHLGIQKMFVVVAKNGQLAPVSGS
jgi:branched-chain amino acid transport system substrate-binding protein